MSEFRHPEPEQRADWKDILALYADPEEIDGAFQPEDRFEPLQLLPPPPRICEAEDDPVRIAFMPRVVPARGDFTAYISLFVAVALDLNQAEGEHFWIARVIKVCPATLKVRWWVEAEEQIWMPDPDYEKIDKIRPAAMLCSLHAFKTNGFMVTEKERENIESILMEWN